MPSAYIWRVCPVLVGAMLAPELHAATDAQNLPAPSEQKAGSESLEFDLDMLKGRWGKDASSIKIIFETEITTAKQVY